ncbi:MAG: RNA polymerase sigma factor [Pseudomonadota bacterium]
MTLSALPIDQKPAVEPPPSLDEFLRSVQQRAFMMARYATGDPDEALDLVQDAMTAFVKHYRDKPAEQRAALFFRSLNNRIIDHYRQRTRRSRWHWPWNNQDRWDADGPDPLIVDQANTQPAVRAEQREFGQDLDRALQALPDRQRQVFLLRAWQGLSVNETAAALNISSGSIKTHYFRALQTLREQLELHHEHA